MGGGAAEKAVVSVVAPAVWTPNCDWPAGAGVSPGTYVAPRWARALGRAWTINASLDAPSSSPTIMGSSHVDGRTPKCGGSAGLTVRTPNCDRPGSAGVTPSTYVAPGWAGVIGRTWTIKARLGAPPSSPTIVDSGHGDGRSPK